MTYRVFFLTCPPLKMSLAKKKLPCLIICMRRGQFQLDYFDFRLLNFHLMTSLQCWRMFWQFQLFQVDTAWSGVRPVQGEVIRGRQKDGRALHQIIIRSSSDHHQVEHYATDHNKLEEAIVDPKSVPISTEVTRAVLEQLFPDLLIFV